MPIFNLNFTISKFIWIVIFHFNMDEHQSSSNGHGITHACIRFRNQKPGEYNIVPIDFVKERVNKSLRNYTPKHDSDFLKDKFYYVFRECITRSTEDNGDATQDLYHKAHVLHLGGKYLYLDSFGVFKNCFISKLERR